MTSSTNLLQAFVLIASEASGACIGCSPRPGQRLIDLCCGTGDLALLRRRAAAAEWGGLLGPRCRRRPLAVARPAASQLQPWLPLRWQQGDALRATGLPAGLGRWGSDCLTGCATWGPIRAAGLRGTAAACCGPLAAAAVLDCSTVSDPATAAGALTAAFQRLLSCASG